MENRWYHKLSETEWQRFLLLSRKNDSVNNIWDKYKDNNDPTTYDDVCNYEEIFWNKTKRLEKLNIILG